MAFLRPGTASLERTGSRTLKGQSVAQNQLAYRIPRTALWTQRFVEFCKSVSTLTRVIFNETTGYAEYPLELPTGLPRIFQRGMTAFDRLRYDSIP